MPTGQPPPPPPPKTIEEYIVKKYRERDELKDKDSSEILDWARVQHVRLQKKEEELQRQFNFYKPKAEKKREAKKEASRKGAPLKVYIGPP